MSCSTHTAEDPAFAMLDDETQDRDDRIYPVGDPEEYMDLADLRSDSNSLSSSTADLRQRLDEIAPDILDGPALMLVSIPEDMMIPVHAVGCTTSLVHSLIR